MTDEIDRLLAAMESKQIKCPECGCNDPAMFSVLFSEWHYRNVHDLTLDGRITTYDDSDWTSPPEGHDTTWLLVCLNTQTGDRQKPCSITPIDPNIVNFA